MGKHAGKHKKRWVYFPRDRSKFTCISNGPGNSSNECKVLNDIGNKYVKDRHFKDNIQDPTSNKTSVNRQ